MEKSQFLQTHLILPDVPEEAVRSIGLEDKKLLSINHTLFNQDTHKECVREKPGVLVIHYYFNEKIEVYHFNYQPFKAVLKEACRVPSPWLGLLHKNCRVRIPAHG